MLSKLRILLIILKLRAYWQIYFDRLYDSIFLLILKLPDSWFDNDLKFVNSKLRLAKLKVIDKLNTPTFLGKKAKTLTEGPTAKFIFFLKHYWEPHTDFSALDYDGFDFKKYMYIFQKNNLTIECVTSITSTVQDPYSGIETVLDEKFNRNEYYLINISRQNNKTYMDSVELFLDHVHFNNLNPHDLLPGKKCQISTIKPLSPSKS